MVAIPVNPDVLLWARQERGIKLDDAANRLKMSVPDLETLEKGARQPTQHADVESRLHEEGSIASIRAIGDGDMPMIWSDIYNAAGRDSSQPLTTTQYNAIRRTSSFIAPPMLCG